VNQGQLVGFNQANPNNIKSIKVQSLCKQLQKQIKRWQFFQAVSFQIFRSNQKDLSV